MQPPPQVGWDPISINSHLPWASKLLILYLLVVVVLSLVKSASVLRMLWSFSRFSRQQPRRGDEFLHVWEACSNKIQSMKRLVFITLLWTVFVATLLVRTSLIQIAEQKAFGPGALIGSIVEVLTMFARGILVCAVLYAACALFEGALLRGRESWSHARANTEDRPPRV
jgi:hypothetical protein